MTREETFVGLDGYPKGWVAVWLIGSTSRITYLENLRNLLTENFSRAMIDMPIGLPDTGYRDCDLKARELLGKHAPRVFLGARRFILSCKDQSAANAFAKARQDKGVSAQLFCLSPKLAQVDDILNRNNQDRIMECHPELVFWRLNSSNGTPSKKTPEGRTLRIKLLEQSGFDNLEKWIAERPTKVKADDILDACACALAARDMMPPLGTGTDAKGLQMKIHY